MPCGRIPEGKAFHLVDTGSYCKACMFCSYLSLSGNTTCTSVEL